MKLKCQPEDFRVFELTEFQADGGPFALYRLTKRSLGTPEAIQQICRGLNVHRRRVSYGGLKDKHAVTRQHVTIEGGPRKPFERNGLHLEYLGQASRPFLPQEIAGNRFQIVLRDMTAGELRKAEAALVDVQQAGLPNYFDDQRFGSVGKSGEFIGQAWCRGDYERALWLALADPHPDDRADDKQQKGVLRDMWGDWPRAKETLARSTLRSIVTFLVDHPTDFRRAFALISVDLRGLYLSALQSGLWNRVAARIFRQTAGDRGEADLATIACVWGTALFPRRLTAEQQQQLTATQLPLPSARAMQDLGAFETQFAEVAGELGLELRELRVKYPRDSFFSKGERALLIPVTSLRFASHPDELYPGKDQLALEFELPRGSYATMLVKRITEV